MSYEIHDMRLGNLVDIPAEPTEVVCCLPAVVVAQYQVVTATRPPIDVNLNECQLSFASILGK